MRASLSLRQVLIAIILFGVAFGYVEAAVVVYLRNLSEPALAHVDPGRNPNDLFPTLTLAQIKTYPALARALEIELGREAATLLMLAAVAIAVGANRAQSAAAFVTAFGVWDAAFYAFLRLFIHWPPSLLTWDLLFILPVPWSGPVLAPLIVSASMIAAGVYVIHREFAGRPVRPSLLHWLGILVGGLVIILSFVWNYPHLIAGGVPHHFPWAVFVVGELIGLMSFCTALAARERPVGN